MSRFDGRPPSAAALRTAADALHALADVLTPDRQDELGDVEWYLRSRLLPIAERREIAARSRERDRQKRLGSS